MAKQLLPTQALTAAEGNQGKKKPRFGLKWFFSQPFKTGNETKPELEDITSPQSIEPDEDSPPVLEPANFGKPKSPVPELLDAGSTRDTTEPRKLFLQPLKAYLHFSVGNDAMLHVPNIHHAGMESAVDHPSFGSPPS